jgi:hypothetical protein
MRARGTGSPSRTPPGPERDDLHTAPLDRPRASSPPSIPGCSQPSGVGRAVCQGADPRALRQLTTRPRGLRASDQTSPDTWQGPDRKVVVIKIADHCTSGLPDNSRHQPTLSDNSVAKFQAIRHCQPMSSFITSLPPNGTYREHRRRASHGEAIAAGVTSPLNTSGHAVSAVGADAVSSPG